MLSIIISSYQQHYFDVLEESIARSAGIPYEIIRIENPGKMGICEAYNKGAAAAQFENLLFLHEDTEFVTQNWGNHLLTNLSETKTGIVGLAGNTYVPNVPFAWWDYFEDTRINIIQYRGEKLLKAYHLKEPAVCIVIDGVFLACRKEVWEKYPFNTQLTGFHGYDINFSTRVASEYQNLVLSDITLKHFSEGNPDREWFNAITEYRPLFRAPARQKTNKKKELFYYLKFAQKCTQFNIRNRKRLLITYNNPKFIGYKACTKNFFKIIFS